MDYDAAYYEEIDETAGRSARVIVPLLLELVRPSSVVDVGCGIGTWLAVLREFGVAQICGIEGVHIDDSSLRIPSNMVLKTDLSRPFRLERRFDLALCLEVAEHLPEESSQGLVDSLTELAPVIVFSAAIPHQGGRNHINEQWPTYWANLFGHRGYVPVDCLRRRIWDDDKVAWWYAQNALLYVARNRFEHYPELQREYSNRGTSQLSLVHPRKYEEIVEWAVSVSHK